MTIFVLILSISGVPDAARRPTGTPAGVTGGNILRFVSHKSLRLNDEPPFMLRYRNILLCHIFNGLIYGCAGRNLLLVTCRFSFRTKTKPIPYGSICCTELDCVQCPRRKGISPIAMGDQRLCLWTLPTLFKKGLDPKTISLRRAASANYRA